MWSSVSLFPTFVQTDEEDLPPEAADEEQDARDHDDDHRYSAAAVVAAASRGPSRLRPHAQLRGGRQSRVSFPDRMRLQSNAANSANVTGPSISRNATNTTGSSAATGHGIPTSTSSISSANAKHANANAGPRTPTPMVPSGTSQSLSVVAAGTAAHLRTTGAYAAAVTAAGRKAAANTTSVGAVPGPGSAIPTARNVRGRSTTRDTRVVGIRVTATGKPASVAARARPSLIMTPAPANAASAAPRAPISPLVRRDLHLPPAMRWVVGRFGPYAVSRSAAEPIRILDLPSSFHAGHLLPPASGRDRRVLEYLTEEDEDQVDRWRRADLEESSSALHIPREVLQYMRAQAERSHQRKVRTRGSDAYVTHEERRRNVGAYHLEMCKLGCRLRCREEHAKP